jgi:hypothetical protein
MRAGRAAHDAFEGLAESRLGFVAHLLGDVADGVLRLTQQATGAKHAPGGQVVDGRLADPAFEAGC